MIFLLLNGKWSIEMRYFPRKNRNAGGWWRTNNPLRMELQTYIINRMCLMLAYFLRKIQTSRINKSQILRIKKGKLSGYCFYVNPNIYWNIQVCIRSEWHIDFHTQCFIMMQTRWSPHPLPDASFPEFWQNR